MLAREPTWRIVLYPQSGRTEIRRLHECGFKDLWRLQRHLTERNDSELRKWRVLSPRDTTPQRIPILSQRQRTSLADAVADEIVARRLQERRAGKRHQEKATAFLQAKAQREAEAVHLESKRGRATGDRSSRGEELLKRFLDILLPFDHVDNYRPPWLGGLELDRYYPELLVAFEFQGDQHFRPTEFSPDASIVQSRDRLKRALCGERGIKLLTLEAADLEYTRLYTILKSRKKAGLLARLQYRCPGRPPKPGKPVQTPRLSRTEQQQLGQLNKEAAAYRAYLNRAFPFHISSRRRRRSAPRRTAEQFWAQGGIE